MVMVKISLAIFLLCVLFANNMGHTPTRLPVGGYQITAAWPVSLGTGNPAYQVMGGFAIGWFLDKFGRELTFAVWFVLTAAFVYAILYYNT